MGQSVNHTQKRVRAYFAPVDRATRTVTLFDPAQNGRFLLDDPPAPWTDLGWVSGFERTCASVISPVRTGSPAATEVQVRTEIDASVRFQFQNWGKLQMALSAGTQQLNLLPTLPGASAAGSGGTADPALAVSAGSTATVLVVDPSFVGGFAEGSLVVVDEDCTAATTGYVGAGVSGAYVKATLSDVDYIRRVSLNVARVHAVGAGTLTLAAPLIAGVPSPEMKVSPVMGFCDREGSTFFQEWSGLFVSEGQQGDRLIWYFPRLQSMAGIGEVVKEAPGGFADLQPSGSFRALPVRDGVDGERVVCFRTYLPA